jgi:hypothetical protein
MVVAPHSNFLNKIISLITSSSHRNSVPAAQGDRRAKAARETLR